MPALRTLVRYRGCGNGLSGEAGLGQVLHQGGQECHQVVEILAVNHAVVGVQVAGGHGHVDRRRAAKGFLHLRPILTVARLHIELQR